MEAFTRLPMERARLRIVGWAEDCAGEPYHRGLQEMAVRDPRVELVPKKPFNETIQEYRRFSLLTIPSVCLETGPLTLLEALAAGVPVYGSERIGQMDVLKAHGTVVAHTRVRRGLNTLGLSYKAGLVQCDCTSKQA